VVAASVEEEGLIHVTEFTERQQRKQNEDNLLDLLIILDSTLDIVSSLRDQYQSTTTQQSLGPILKASGPDDLILLTLQEKHRDILLFRSRVETLRSKVSGTTELVGCLYPEKLRDSRLSRYPACWTLVMAGL
jgi:hypothetical protein